MPTPDQAPEVVPAQELPLPPEPLKVMVADDDPDYVLILLTLLRAEGFEAKGYHRAEGLIADLDAFRPHAILLDITMPGMSGYEAARQVRQALGNAVLLISITAATKGADKILAKLVGFDYHLPKPYDPNVLLALLHVHGRKVLEKAPTTRL